MVSDSEDDKPIAPDMRKKPVVKGLQVGSSPARRTAMGVTQANGIHKTRLDSSVYQRQKSSSGDHSARLRLDYAYIMLHRSMWSIPTDVRWHYKTVH